MNPDGVNRLEVLGTDEVVEPPRPAGEVCVWVVHALGVDLIIEEHVAIQALDRRQGFPLRVSPVDPLAQEGPTDQDQQQHSPDAEAKQRGVALPDRRGHTRASSTGWMSKANFPSPVAN